MKYKVVYHLPSGADEEEDELFYSETEAHDAAREGLSNYRTGAEEDYLLNPGDNPLPDDDGYSYDVVGVDELAVGPAQMGGAFSLTSTRFLCAAPAKNG